MPTIPRLYAVFPKTFSGDKGKGTSVCRGHLEMELTQTVVAQSLLPFVHEHPRDILAPLFCYAKTFHRLSNAASSSGTSNKPQLHAGFPC